MTSQVLRETCRNLLECGKVDVVVGYGSKDGGVPHPVFVTDPADTEQLVFDDRCTASLVGYLTRADVRRLGRPAVVVKGCDERALVALVQEAQLARQDLYVIGMTCTGVGDPMPAKCRTCDTRLPRFADVVLGDAQCPTAEPEGRFAELDEFMSRSPEERFAFWTSEFERCVRCYACRQACPLCYCKVCVMDKNRPQAVDTSAHPKGNLAFHITRAFHLAGRCVGCEECVRVCPAQINLRLLNLSVARAAEEQFGSRAGTDPTAEPVTGSYSLADREDFIQ